MEAKPASESRAVKSAIVLPPDTNNHGTMFGGRKQSQFSASGLPICGRLLVCLPHRANRLELGPMLNSNGSKHICDRY